MKAYIAAPIFTGTQLAVVDSIEKILINREYDVFNPYKASRPIWKGRAPRNCTEAERRTVLDQNIRNLHDSDIMVAWVGGSEDGKVDTGVAWELGYFRACPGAGSDNFTVAYIDPNDRRRSMNLMLAGTVDAVVTSHEQLDAVVMWLREPQQWIDVSTLYRPERVLEQESEAVA